MFLARFTGKLESLSADDVTAAAGRRRDDDWEPIHRDG